MGFGFYLMWKCKNTYLTNVRIEGEDFGLASWIPTGFGEFLQYVGQCRQTDVVADITFNRFCP